MKGTIRSIRDDKDYAFIVSGPNRDIFLHRHDFQGNWTELIRLHQQQPTEVEFEIKESPKGLRAEKCRLVSL